MRRSDIKWIAYGVVLGVAFIAAKLFSWDIGSTSEERDRMPTAGLHGRRGAYTYWSSGFGGK